ncbi:flagellar export chaperone FliS [Desulfobacter sp.]|uniref:flagellar export chaperone FliS n=1 Tax=Desulfobacter sp. TaxID=2294 RepID=UPI003D0D0ECF
MSVAKNLNTYLNNHYEGMTPENLIHLLYKGALKHLKCAREGIIEKSPKKRGEHLSRVIAIVSELNASIDPTMNDDSTRFLRGLYTSILMELPKISLTNDVKTIDLASAYIEKLNEIWETQVLNNPGGKPAAPATAPASYGGYNSGNTMEPRSIFA